MLVTINEGAVDINVDFEATIDLVIDPGVWEVSYRGADFSVTHLRGRLTGGHIYFAYPKGVARKHNGQWAAQERILVGLLPEKPLLAWNSLPEAVRDAVEDTYLLARDDVPEHLGTSVTHGQG